MKNVLFLDNTVEGPAEPDNCYNKFQNERLGE